jgi:hypothetical protein
MKLFIEPSINSLTYRGNEIVNRPVNILLVETFFKSKTAYYPDNDGKPSITVMFNENRVEWVYDTEEERDGDYNRLLNISRG